MGTQRTTEHGSLISGRLGGVRPRRSFQGEGILWWRAAGNWPMRVRVPSLSIQTVPTTSPSLGRVIRNSEMPAYQMRTERRPGLSQVRGSLPRGTRLRGGTWCDTGGRFESCRVSLVSLCLLAAAPASREPIVRDAYNGQGSIEGGNVRTDLRTIGYDPRRDHPSRSIIERLVNKGVV